MQNLNGFNVMPQIYPNNKGILGSTINAFGNTVSVTASCGCHASIYTPVLYSS